VTTNLANNDDRIAAMALQPDGRIVVAGRSFGSHGYVLTVAHYNPDGSLDKTFNGTGILTTNLASEADAVAIYPNAGTANDGKIIVAGQSNGNISQAVRNWSAKWGCPGDRGRRSLPAG
jgi:uncharacterized delta-60 repeat protein